MAPRARYEAVRWKQVAWTGRPRKPVEIERLILEMARDNPKWGLHPNQRGTPQSGIRDRSKYDQACPNREQNGSRTAAGNHLADLSQGALGSHLGNAVTEYTEHSHRERNHQGLENELIDRYAEDYSGRGSIECRERIGGLLRHYRRAA